jgi:hypothetical protein
MTKTKLAKLDPRKSRKLTSRECCSILGGYVGGMLTSNLIGVEAARESLEFWIECPIPWVQIRNQADRGAAETADAIAEARAMHAQDAGEGMRMYWRGLGAVIAGLRVIASERAVSTAVRWLYQTDAWWPKKPKAEPEAELDHESEGTRTPAGLNG